MTVLTIINGFISHLYACPRVVAAELRVDDRSSAHNLVDRERRLAGGAASLGSHRNLACLCTGRYVSRNLRIGVRREACRLHPAKRHLRRLCQSGAFNRDRSSHRTTRRNARNRRQHIKRPRAGQRARTSRNCYGAGERSRRNGRGDEARARHRDGRSGGSAELHHRRVAEALAQNSDLGTLLAGRSL